jgi:hypothetical protein
MQTLLSEVATILLGDAAALVNGFGRIATPILMAPIERIANACEVAGILPRRRAAGSNPGFVMRNANAIHHARRERRSHRRGSGFGCLRFLGDLT